MIYVSLQIAVKSLNNGHILTAEFVQIILVLGIVKVLGWPLFKSICYGGFTMFLHGISESYEPFGYHYEICTS